MMRVLLVKMSSLGDVVHTLAAVTDAARINPGLRFDWVVEEAYASIPAWHSAVERIIPVALRRWRKSPWAMIRDNEWFRFRDTLQSVEYDLVLDAQGLMKSAWIGQQAHGPLVGRSRKSAREPLAAAFYKRAFDVDLSLPEVEQLRQLFALALNYPQPSEPAEFGLKPGPWISGPSGPPYAVLAHGAAWPNKLWPDQDWKSLAQHLAVKGFGVWLPWGSDTEKSRAEDIAAACGGKVLPRLEIPELAGMLRHARLVVGLDTGLTHIAIAQGTPTVTLYGPSVPVYRTLARGNALHLVSSDSREVDTDRKNTVPLQTVLAVVDTLLSERKAPA